MILSPFPAALIHYFSNLSTHQPLSNLTITASHHNPSGQKDPQGPRDRGTIQDSGHKSMTGGAWESHDYLWVQVSIQYLPVPEGFGKRRERLGRGWQDLWSLVPLWHLGNRSWFPAVLLSVYASRVEALSACNHLCCLLSLVFFLFFNYLNTWASPSLPIKILSFPVSASFRNHQFQTLKGHTFIVDQLKKLAESNPQ